MKLTVRLLDTFKFAGKTPTTADIRWDDSLPGFGVRVWPSGELTFLIRYRHDGRKRYMTLGRYGTLALEEARQLARTRLAEVLGGIDPLAEKRRRAAGETVADLAKAFIERHAKLRKSSWRDDEQRLTKYVVPKLGSRRVDEIRQRDVAKLHADIGKKQPTTANRVLAVLSKAFNIAPRLGFLEEGAPNPCKGVERFPEVKRDRFVLPAELPALAEVINAEPQPFRELWWMYLLTGLRRSALRTLTWDQVDFERRELRFEQTKAGRIRGEVRAFHLPLSKPALEVLQGLPRLLDNPHVFFGRRRGRPLSEVNDRWQRVRAKATAKLREQDPHARGLEDVRIHDLRRTLGSWMAQSGASLALIGRVLDHSNQSTTAIYARFHSSPVVEALDSVGEKLIAASTPVPALPAADDQTSA